MQINITWDASVDTDPNEAAFKSVVNQVAAFYDKTFTDDVTINIAVGYGEVGGHSLGVGEVGYTSTDLLHFSYKQVYDALKADLKTGDDATALDWLPSTDPTPNGTGNWVMTPAEAKALGLRAGNDSRLDGSIGFSSSDAFTYDNSKGVAAGTYDLYGAVAHEISEVMGRKMKDGDTIYDHTNNVYTPLDLFHFSASGKHDFSSYEGYFSIDNGATSLKTFNVSGVGDYADWASDPVSDAFDNQPSKGAVLNVSETDLKSLDVLGWDRATTPAMRLVAFYAVDSATGDSYSGYAYTYNSVEQYAEGENWTSVATDQAGGHWTYHISSVTAADSAHRDPVWNRQIFDTEYTDKDRGTTYFTVNGHAGTASGTGTIGSEIDYISFNGASYKFGQDYYIVPDQPTMQKVSFTATESKTGDSYSGYVYDNTGTYTASYSWTSPTTDQAGGFWGYTVTGITVADSAHQSASWNGQVFDTEYTDKDRGTTYFTVNGHAGTASGTNGLGSDGDTVTVNGTNQKFGAGYYVVPEQLTPPATMKLALYTAVESVTGDKISGFALDNTGAYQVGSTATTGNDQLGGHWTYTVTSVAAAPNAFQDASYNGKLYDYAYFDADLNQSFTPTNYGTAVGTGGLGSDGDTVTVNGTLQKFGRIGGAEYVVPEQAVTRPTMKLALYTAVESVTGDKISGFVLDNTGAYHVGSTATIGNDQRGGHWTYTVTSVATAPDAFQSASYNGKLYDYAYFDADLNQSFTPTNYGTAVGTSGLGSDGDTVYWNGAYLKFGNVDGQEYVLDRAPVIAPTASFVSPTHSQTSLAASALFSVSDVDHDMITKYQVADSYGTGHWVLNGTNEPAGQWIDVSASDLAHLSFQTGSSPDLVWARACDGTLWSDWKSFTVNAPADHVPVVTASDVSATHNQSFAASSLFSVSDQDGDAMTKHQVASSYGTGHWVLNGMREPAGKWIDASASDLAHLSYQTGSGSDLLWARAYDGTVWSDWKSFTVNAPVDHAPVMMASDVSAIHNQSFTASSLFSVSDQDRDTTTKYQVASSYGTGHWVLNGTSEPAGKWIDVAASDLAHLSYQTGSGSDLLWARAYDGTVWSDWKSFTVNAPVDHAPVVTASDVSPAHGQTSLAATSLFSVSDQDGDAITKYQVADSYGTGHWVLNGTNEPAGKWIDVSASDLAHLSFQVGSSPDLLRARAYDGTVWSNWKSFTVNAPASGTASQSQADGSAASLHASTSADESFLGGSGPDTFIFAKNFGHGTVEHFTPGQDVLEFHAGVFSSIDDLLQHHAAQVGSDVVISDAAGDVLTLKGVALASLHASDFHLV